MTLCVGVLSIEKRDRGLVQSARLFIVLLYFRWRERNIFQITKLGRLKAANLVKKPQRSTSSRLQMKINF